MSMTKPAIVVFLYQSPT